MKNVLFILTLFFLFACNKAYEASEESAGLYTKDAMENLKSTAEQTSEEKPADNQAIERKLIKTGNIEFETKDLDKTAQRINAAKKKYKAYASNENEYSSENRLSRTITLRIPASNFDAALAEIAEGVDHFDRKTINVSDVTEEFLDVQARLKTKKELELRYIQLLSKAQKVSEILEIERELVTLRSDIESFEGRLKYLENQVSLSTLTIDYYKSIKQDNRFWAKVKSGFGNGWDFLLTILLGIINVWPVWIIGYALFWMIRRIRAKK
ncbi:MAG: hypothetical protein RLZZ337_745 [Bacteroidota bacterium]|jgi:hypothetical protein